MQVDRDERGRQFMVIGIGSSKWNVSKDVHQTNFTTNWKQKNEGSEERISRGQDATNVGENTLLRWGIATEKAADDKSGSPNKSIVETTTNLYTGTLKKDKSSKSQDEIMQVLAFSRICPETNQEFSTGMIMRKMHICGTADQNNSHENWEISILTMKKARTKVQNFRLKLKKDFQIRTHGTRKEHHRRDKLEWRNKNK